MRPGRRCFVGICLRVVRKPEGYRGRGPLLGLSRRWPVDDARQRRARGVGWHYVRKHNRGSREVGTISRREGRAIPGLETTACQGEIAVGRQLPMGVGSWYRQQHVDFGNRFAAVAPQPLKAVDLPVTVAAPAMSRAVFSHARLQNTHSRSIPCLHIPTAVMNTARISLPIPRSSPLY